MASRILEQLLSLCHAKELETDEAKEFATKIIRAILAALKSSQLCPKQYISAIKGQEADSPCFPVLSTCLKEETYLDVKRRSVSVLYQPAYLTAFRVFKEGPEFDFARGKEHVVRLASCKGCPEGTVCLNIHHYSWKNEGAPAVVKLQQEQVGSPQPGPSNQGCSSGPINVQTLQLLNQEAPASLQVDKEEDDKPAVKESDSQVASSSDCEQHLEAQRVMEQFHNLENQESSSPFSLQDLEEL